MQQDTASHVLSPASAAPAKPAAQPAIVVQHQEGEGARRVELIQGLRREPAQISPKFFYDTQGCALYEAICALSEYYPPRAEAAVFQRHLGEIAAELPSRAQWVDLGCGDGVKARRWIAATSARRYIGVDIAEPWLRSALKQGAALFPNVQFDGVVTDFTRGLRLEAVLNPDLPSVFFYPGSSIGNFRPDEARGLLAQVGAHLGPGDRLLIGVDTPKDRATLLAAYDDALGVTAAFNRNVLRAVNRELGCDFAPEGFAHRAVFDEEESRVEMHLVARRGMQVRLAAGMVRQFEPGEHIVTEYSYKYNPDRFAGLLAEAGFDRVQCYTGPDAGYGVYVAAAAPQGARR